MIFLAHGEAVKGMVNIANQAHAKIAGIAIVVAKTFQGGSSWVKDHGYRLESLANIDSFKNGQVHFFRRRIKCPRKLASKKPLF